VHLRLLRVHSGLLRIHLRLLGVHGGSHGLLLRVHLRLHRRLLRVPHWLHGGLLTISHRLHGRLLRISHWLHRGLHGRLHGLLHLRLLGVAELILSRLRLSIGVDLGKLRLRLVLVSSRHLHIGVLVHGRVVIISSNALLVVLLVVVLFSTVLVLRHFLAVVVIDGEVLVLVRVEGQGSILNRLGFLLVVDLLLWPLSSLIFSSLGLYGLLLELIRLQSGIVHFLLLIVEQVLIHCRGDALAEEGRSFGDFVAAEEASVLGDVLAGELEVAADLGLVVLEGLGDGGADLLPVLLVLLVLSLEVVEESEVLQLGNGEDHAPALDSLRGGLRVEAEQLVVVSLADALAVHELVCVVEHDERVLLGREGDGDVSDLH